MIKAVFKKIKTLKESTKLTILNDIKINILAILFRDWQVCGYFLDMQHQEYYCPKTTISQKDEAECQLTLASL